MSSKSTNVCGWQMLAAAQSMLFAME